MKKQQQLIGNVSHFYRSLIKISDDGKKCNAIDLFKFYFCEEKMAKMAKSQKNTSNILFIQDTKIFFFLRVIMCGIMTLLLTDKNILVPNRKHENEFVTRNSRIFLFDKLIIL